MVLGAEAAGCLALPANHSAAGPRVSHISRCPDVTPQRWPGLWPDAQHSLLTPSGPLRVCQVSTGTEVGRHKGRKEERACVQAASGGAQPMVLSLQRDRRSGHTEQRSLEQALELLGPSIDVTLG